MLRHAAHGITRHRRSSIGVLGALAIAGVVLGPAGLASGKRPNHGAHRAARTANQSAGGVQQAAVAAVEQLIHDGTINQQQANVIDGQINAGSIDPKQLVDRGVVTSAQMHAVANAIDQVKARG